MVAIEARPLPIRAPARRPPRGTHLVAAASILLLAAMVYLTICGSVALRLTRTERKGFTHFPENYGLAYEPATFPSRRDGLSLAGWLLLPPATAAMQRPVIVVHGHQQDRESEVEGRVMEIAARLVRSGRPTLLFDLRGWGHSEGDRFTLGAREADDVGGAVDYLANRGLAADGVDLLGYSMGASTALLLAPAEPRVRAVAEDSGYAVLADELADQLPKDSGLPSAFTPGTILMTRLLVGFDVYAVRPVDGMPALAARGTPLLVIHGQADRRVDISHAHRLVAAYGPEAETFFVPGAGHVGSYLVDPEAYLARLTDFFDRAEQEPMRGLPSYGRRLELGVRKPSALPADALPSGRSRARLAIPALPLLPATRPPLESGELITPAAVGGRGEDEYVRAPE